MWDDARREVDHELSQLREVLGHPPGLIAVGEAGEPDLTQFLALSAVLHSFYSGVENIFRRIAKGIDSALPTGPAWHRNLLVSMAGATAKRPAVISGELLETLTDYLNFRHLFRSVYGFELQWPNMAHLVRVCRNTLEQLEAELNVFFASRG